MKTLKQLGINYTPWHVKTYNAFETINDVCDSEGREFLAAVPKSESNLIAAAPELYNILLKAIGTCHDCKADCTNCINSNKFWMPEARKAIAKIEGK